MQKVERSKGIAAIGWSIITSNLILLTLYYFSLSSTRPQVVPRFISFLSMAAVFPLDFFYTYLREFWLVHFFWIFIVVLTAFGILLFNKFARKVFIVLNILNIVILTYIVLRHWGQILVFLDYFFKLYFNLVAAGTYAGFLTIPEVREQFKSSLEGIKFHLWWKEYRLKQSVEKDAEGYYKLGIAYDRLGRQGDAISHFEKAIAINPENAGYHSGLGTTCFRQKRYAESIKALKEAIRLNPVDWEATHTLGLVYAQEGCTKEAMEIFKRATHILPEKAASHYFLGKTCCELGHLHQAEEELRQTIALEPRHAEAAYHLGLLYMNQEKYAQAREMLQRTGRINWGHVEAQFQLGLANMKLERYKEAVRCFKNVTSLDRQHKTGHYQLGFVYAMLKDFDSAWRQQKILKDIDPDLAENLAMLLK